MSIANNPTRYKGYVTLFMESNPPAFELVRGLLEYGYGRKEITDMTYLTFEQVTELMRDNNLKELS